MLKKISALKQNTAFNYTMLALFGIGTGLLSLMLGTAFFGLPMFWTYFSSPAVLTLNLLPPVILIYILYFISGRAWVAFTFPSFFIQLLSAIQFFKVQVRGDPFLASDVLLMREALNVTSYYSLTLNWKLFFALAAFACGILVCVLFLKHKVEKTSLRIGGSAALIAIIALLYVFVYSDADIYDRAEGGHPANPWSFTERFISRGFVYPFTHSIRYAFPVTPQGFDRSDARKLLEDYECGVIPDDKKVNVITIMLESYTDLSAFGVLDFKTDVYGPLHSLQSESYTGMLINNVAIGKTIDTERLFLTGYTRLTRFGPASVNYFRYLFSEHFSSSVNSYVHYLNSQGYHTEGFASVSGWFYERASVNRYLGFTDYYFLEDHENSNQTDEFFFSAVRSLYETRDRNTPYCSFNLSAQNHGPYDITGTFEPHMIEQGDLTPQAFYILNNYLQGIHDTTQRLVSFIDELRHDPEPVVVLIAGDHMPWMGNDGFVFSELGINVDQSTEEGFLNFYSTPYLIWANDSAKAVLENDFTGQGGSFSPSFLMGELFMLCSWEGDSNMQSLRELQTRIDVISAPTGMFRENGAFTPSLTGEGTAAYNRHRIIEFYRLHNFMY